jgi:elongation factor G
LSSRTNATHSESFPARFVAPTANGIKEALSRRSILRSGIDDLIDVTVELYDGSYHEVDSSEMAFKIAGATALEDALMKAGPALLEPVMRVDVGVPSEYAGGVLEDLAKRRALIHSVNSDSSTCFVGARIRFAMMIGYERDLRSRTGERATFSTQFDGYEQCDVRPGFDDDGFSGVRMPRTPSPNPRDSSIALPETDEDSD